jgi:hypothetical protein
MKKWLTKPKNINRQVEEVGDQLAWKLNMDIKPVCAARYFCSGNRKACVWQLVSQAAAGLRIK